MTGPPDSTPPAMAVETLATPAGRREARQINGLSPEYPTDPGIGNQCLTGHGSNSFQGRAEKENPADAATSNGADHLESSQSNDIPKRARVARALGFALTLGTFEAWSGFGYVLTARLSRKERAALAYAALSSLGDEDGYRVASTALFGTFQGEAHA